MSISSFLAIIAFRIFNYPKLLAACFIILQCILGVTSVHAKGNQASVKRIQLEFKPRKLIENVYIGFGISNYAKANDGYADLFESESFGSHSLKIGYLGIDKETGFIGGVGIERARLRGESRSINSTNRLTRTRYSAISLYGQFGYRSQHHTGILFGISRVIGGSPHTTQNLGYTEFSVGSITRLGATGELLFNISRPVSCEDRFLTCGSRERLTIDFLFYLE